MKKSLFILETTTYYVFHHFHHLHNFIFTPEFQIQNLMFCYRGFFHYQIQIQILTLWFHLTKYIYLSCCLKMNFHQKLINVLPLLVTAKELKHLVKMSFLYKSNWSKFQVERYHDSNRLRDRRKHCCKNAWLRWVSLSRWLRIQKRWQSLWSQESIGEENQLNYWYYHFKFTQCHYIFQN